MTQDEIIEMYLQVSKELCNDTEWCWAGVGEPLQMFAKLVAAKAIKELESQEPVAIVTGDAWETDIRFLPEGMALPPDTKLYTHPQRTWVGLTDEDWKEIEDMPDTFDQGVAWAQRRLREKNT